MQLLKLTVLSSLLFAFAFSFTSCEKEAEKKKNGNLLSKTDIPLSGAQVVPASVSGATGKLAVTYNKNSKVLAYTVSWTGLTDTITAAVIQGPAPTGYTVSPTLVKQVVFGFTAPTAANLKSTQATYPFQAGSYTGSVFADEVVIKEQDLLNHLYYLSIRTKTNTPGMPYATTGEIRAQIRFQ
jgi:CHRD domain